MSSMSWRRQNHRDAAFLVQPLDEIPDRELADRIEPDRGGCEGKAAGEKLPPATSRPTNYWRTMLMVGEVQVST